MSTTPFQSEQSRAASAQSGYFSEAPIAALATPLGGALAIIRLSGPGIFKLAQKLFLSSVDLSKTLDRHAVLTPIWDLRGQKLDEVLLLKFSGPKSYTGEDLLELHIHGSAFNAQKILYILADLGIRQALPGEFSFRAVKNGKMTLFQAEAVADLIASSNESAVALALEKLSGKQNEVLGKIFESLKQITVLSEAGIDFSDQDLEELELRTLQKRVFPIIEDVRLLEESFNRGSRIQQGVPVAFVGLPNAGKSSFFNALLGEDRSIVSATAGTTRDVIREKLTLQGKNTTVTFRLQDLAGMRHAEDHIEKEGVLRAHAAVKEADLVLWIVDAKTSLAQWQEVGALYQKLKIPPARGLGVLTKVDLLDSQELKLVLERATQLSSLKWITTSAHTGLGVTEAARAMVEKCETQVALKPGEIVLTRLDQLEALKKVRLDLERAILAPEMDLFAADLHQALTALGGLVGDTLPDDILGKIFSEFCIGK